MTKYFKIQKAGLEYFSVVEGHFKELGGLSRSGNQSFQLIGREVPDKASLALKFSNLIFLAV